MATDHTKMKIFVVLLCFWTLCLIFTNIFSDYLSSQTLTNFDPKCMKPELKDFVKCTNIQLYAEDQNFITAFKQAWQFLTNLIINVQSQIPLINLLVPLERIMLVTYNTSVPLWLTVILDTLGILTVVISYGLITEAFP